MKAFQRYPRLSALALGVVAAVGFPPLSLWPLTLFALAATIPLIRSAGRWQSAFARGWFFGVGHFTFANNWIADAFTYQSEMPAILGWVAVPLLALYLAVYPALATVGAWLLGRERGATAWIAIFAAMWIVTEWLRSWVFTGYAWDPLGLALLGPWDRPGLAAILPWMGTYALSGLAVLLGGIVWILVSERRWLLLCAVAALLAVGMYLPAGAGEQGTVRYTLVQPYIPQEERDDASKFEEHFLRAASLTARPDRSLERLVLWPEAGVPDYLEDGYPQRYYTRMTAGGDPEFARARIAQVIGPQAHLLTGVVNLNIENGRAATADNAVIAIDGNGDITAEYAKAHLVPYGEYLALRWLLEPLGATRLVAGTIDFKPGPGPRSIEAGGFGKVGVQICYEIIFSGQVADRSNRPDFIYNPSNEGWFGSFASPQFTGQSRMRAIEEGLPVLRSTTTGISSVIDAHGVVRDAIGVGEADFIDGFVPPARPPTPFAQLGNWLPLGWAALLLALAFGVPSLVARRRAQR